MNFIYCIYILFSGALGFLLVSLFTVYALHLETDPLTGRTRFILLNNEQQDALGRLTLDAVCIV